MKKFECDYDTILYIKSEPVDIDERVAEPKGDPRAFPGKGVLGFGKDTAWGYTSICQTGMFKYGNILRSQLSLGPGYSVEVYDFDDEIFVRVNYTNPASGKGMSKGFLIVFDPTQKKGKGIIKSSLVKRRSISDVSQAASYIRSSCSSMVGATYSAD